MVDSGGMAGDRWTEELDDGDASLVIEVDAVDVARTEQREMKTFLRALQTPPAESEVRFEDPRGRVTSSLDALRLMLAAATFIGNLIFMAFVGAVTERLGIRLSPVGWAVAFLCSYLCTLALLTYRYRASKRPPRDEVRDRFTLTLDSAGFAVSNLRGAAAAPKEELAMIERFEGDLRLAILRKDGQRAALPLTLGSLPRNRALAERLNEALVNVRANTGGYRGAGPRVEIGPEPACEDESSGEDAEALARQRRL